MLLCNINNILYIRYCILNKKYYCTNIKINDKFQKCTFITENKLLSCKNTRVRKMNVYSKYYGTYIPSTTITQSIW